MATPTYSELLDLTLEAIRSLSTGIKSFQIKDRTYTYADLRELWEQHDRLKMLVAIETAEASDLTQTAVISFGSPLSTLDED